MFDNLKNKTIFLNKYHTNSEAVVISCYYNSEKSPYRLKAFKAWHSSIKHLNHRVIECVIGDGTPELGFLNDKNITTINTPDLLWHKESILNKIISDLPKEFKYIFWIDADVIFTNLDWLTDGVKALQTSNIIQPFEYCVHLDENQTVPTFNMNVVTQSKSPNRVNSKVWRSFSANFSDKINWESENYNEHGHVGFAWGARREILDAVPLYDRALIGGADHLICHAAAGQIPCSCITKSFTDNLDEINEWSRRFAYIINGKIGYVKGNLFHIWHGDIEKRQYLKRIQDFTPTTKEITERDENGLHVAGATDTTYVKDYFKHREIPSSGSTRMNATKIVSQHKTSYSSIPPPPIRRSTSSRVTTYVHDENDGFVDSMAAGFITDSTLMGGVIGGNMMGTMIGAELRDSLNTPQMPDTPQFDGFNDGSSGGGGATGDWSSNNDNFS